MHRLFSNRFWIELTLSLTGACLTALTISLPTWIEGLFDIDPDAGSGLSEWEITLAFAIATVALFALAGRTWRRSRRIAGQYGSQSS